MARDTTQVQARFYVQSIRKTAQFQGIAVELQAVTRDKSNNEWSEYTPVGRMEMNVTQGPAAEWFERMLGKDLAITFEERNPAETAKQWGE